jgi:hypothetical protein
MEGSRTMVAVSFAIIVTALYLVAIMYIVNPFLRRNFIVLDDAVALYIDTLSSVEKGKVTIPIEPGTINKVDIVYLEEGDHKEVEKDGWYVAVTYRILADKTEKSLNVINTYPAGGDFETGIFSPDFVCITKSRGDEYPRVTKC